MDDISVISPLPTDINIGSSCNKRNTGSVYLGGYATPVVRGRTGVFQVSGIPMKTIFNPNTNPTPTPSEKKLKTVMSTNKNELRNKMKPTVN